jgi:hypothetical protein
MEEVGLRLVEVQQRAPDCPREGVTSRDGVTLGPRDGVTSDVIGQSRCADDVFQTRVGVSFS